MYRDAESLSDGEMVYGPFPGRGSAILVTVLAFSFLSLFAWLDADDWRTYVVSCDLQGKCVSESGAQSIFVSRANVV